MATRLRVRVEAETVADFCAETGWEAAPASPPAAFPAVWLREPALKQIFREATPPGLVPVHEAQKFFYARPLEIGADYDLTVELARENMPERLIATARIFAKDGAAVGEMIVTLRLFATPEGAR